MRKLPLSVNIVHLQKEEGKEAKVRRRGKGGGRGGRREQKWGRERDRQRALQFMETAAKGEVGYSSHC